MRLDKLYEVDLHETLKTAMAWLDGLQHRQPAKAIVAAALVFLLLCDRFGLDPRRVLETGDRVLRNAREREPVPVRAIAAYMREEWRDA